jgi:hypothetical protein
MRPGNDLPSRLLPLAVPLYVVASILILFPLLEIGAQLDWSASPATINWRTGTVGLLTGALVTPVFGLMVAVVAAHFFQHRLTARVLTAVAGVGALALVLVLGGFLLDSVQLRPSVAEAMRRPFTMAVLKASLNLILSIGALVTIAVGSYRASKAARRYRSADD